MSGVKKKENENNAVMDRFPPFPWPDEQWSTGRSLVQIRTLEDHPGEGLLCSKQQTTKR